MDIFNKNVCRCRGVSFEQIEDAIKNGADTVEKVAEATNATKGCGRCKSQVKDIVESKIK